MCRTACGYTQKDLAEFSNISDMEISKYEHSKCNIPPARAEKLAGILGVHKYALLNPSLESEIAVVHTLAKIDAMYGLEFERLKGDIYIKFPLYCDEIRYYVESLFIAKNILLGKMLSYDEFQYMKCTMGTPMCKYGK